MNLYLFDMDNTILDVNHIHEKAYKKMYEDIHGINHSLCLPKGQERTTYNIIRCTLTGKVPGVDVEKRMKAAVDSMVQLYMTQVNPLFLHSNVDSVLEKLGNKGMVAMFTGGAGKVTHAILKKTGVHSRFHHISTCDDAETRRNIVKHAIENASLGVKFDKIFVIGDDVADIDAAKANNAIPVGVAIDGYFTKKQLENAGAEIVIENWKDQDWILEKLE